MQKLTNVTAANKKILIIDEYAFSRICSAILADAGYDVTITSVSDLSSSMNTREYDVIVMSYPYCAPIFDEIGRRNSPVILLADNFDEMLIRRLDTFGRSYCMIKPIDYEKFKALVGDALDDNVSLQGGYHIV